VVLWKSIGGTSFKQKGQKVIMTRGNGRLQMTGWSQSGKITFPAPGFPRVWKRTLLRVCRSARKAKKGSGAESHYSDLPQYAVNQLALNKLLLPYEARGLVFGSVGPLHPRLEWRSRWHCHCLKVK